VTPGVFFDLDRTLMAGSSGFHWARAARRAGLTTRRQLAGDAMENIKFRLRGSTDEGTVVVRDRVGAFLKDRRVADVERLSPMVLAGVLPRLYPKMLETAYEHQDAGRPVFIVTAASQGTAEMLAHVLFFDGAAGSKLEERDGLYTGSFDGPFCYGEGKPVRMRELAAERGIDLAESWAYSDSASDLPMLRAVGHPVVVNPDRDLRQIAVQEGWEVLHLDRLPRRLKLLAALAAAACVGACTVGRGHVAARAQRRA